MSTIIPWDLIIAKLKGSLSVEDEVVFLEWIEIGENRELFSQIEIIWDKIQNKVSVYEPDVDHYWLELSKRINKVDSRKENTEEEQPRPKIFKLKRLYRNIAAIAILALVSTAAIIYFMNGDKATPVVYTYTSSADRQKVELPDGTVVILNSNTVLTYSNTTDPDLRAVTLTGEAYFDVKYNPEVPFVVTSGDVSVKVHGTEFNVSSYASSKKIIVSLYKGSVSLEITGVNMYLEPNEEAHFDKETRVINVERGDIESSKIWSQDKIKIENKNIRDVCLYLSKLYQVGITIDSSVPNNQSYTFTIINGQPLEDILQTMSSITPIKYSYSKNEILITSKQ